jgi:hypothetical protein
MEHFAQRSQTVGRQCEASILGPDEGEALLSQTPKSPMAVEIGKSEMH